MGTRNLSTQAASSAPPAPPPPTRLRALPAPGPTPLSWPRQAALAVGGGAVAVAALWGLGRYGHGLVAPRPLALVALVIAGAVSACWVGDRAMATRPGTASMHLRVATQVAGVTVVLYLVGWGPALAVGFAFPVLNNTFVVGVRGRWALIGWSVVSLAVAQALVDGGVVSVLLTHRVADGVAVADALAVSCIVVVVARHASGREAADGELVFAASHDHLTGLMNRSAFVHRLQRAVAGARRTDRPVALVFCDLIGFKDVNDRLGHKAGDQALAEVGRRLTAAIRGQDLVGRFAGDEFVVGLTTIESRDDVIRAAERLLGAFDQPVTVGRDQATLGVSIGIALSRGARVPVEDLLAAADAAMYQAKSRGVSTWVLREVSRR